MVRIAQLVRASDCGSEGRGFESHFSPIRLSVKAAFFLFLFGIKYKSFESKQRGQSESSGLMCVPDVLWYCI